MQVRTLPATRLWQAIAVVAVVMAGLAALPGAQPPTYTVTGSADDDTVEIQTAIDAAATSGGTVTIPAGTYSVSGLRGARNVSLVGAGRESTILELRCDCTLLTITGAERLSYMEADYASRIEGIGFDADGHGGTGVRWEGVTYFEVDRALFRGFDVGVWFAGSLQARVDDTKFLSNRTGIRFTAEPIDYYTSLPKLPPSRVLIEWSAFYDNTWRAIDYSGGSQLLVRDVELGMNGTNGDDTSAALWVEGASDPVGPGLVADGLWVESSHGYAAIVLRGKVAHSIRDSWLAYTDARFAISVGADSLLTCDNVRMDEINTVTTVEGARC